MKKFSLSIQYLIFFSLAIIISFSYGCSSSRKSNRANAKEFEKYKTTQIYSTPKTLIYDYKRLKEHHIVSWLWVKPGFNLNDCRNVKIMPIRNYSDVKYEWAEEKLGQDLDKVFSSYKTASGTMDLEISAAIIDLIPKRRIFKRNITPKVSVELIIVDKNTKTVYCRISHYNKAAELKAALDGLISDLKNLSDKTLSR